MIRHYFKVAWRNLLKYKISSLIGITGLAVGFLCFIFCGYCAEYILSTDKNFKNFDRLAIVRPYILEENNDKIYLPGTNSITRSILQDGFAGTIEYLTGVSFLNSKLMTLEFNDKWSSYHVNYIEVDTNFSKVFDLELIYGNWETINRQTNSVVLNKSFANKLFGDENPIGIELYNKDGITKYTISGIIKDIPANTSISAYQKIDAIFVNDEKGEINVSRDDNPLTGVSTFALFRKSKSYKDANKLIDPDKHNLKIYNYFTLPQFSPINTHLLDDYASFAYVFGGIGLLILISSILNFVIFIGGNFLARIKEFKIRQTIGSDRIRLYLLIFIELLVYFSLVIFIVCILIELTSNSLNFEYLRFSINIEIGKLYKQAFQYLIISILIIGMASFLASLYLDFTTISDGIRKNKSIFRNTMLWIQITICTFFFTCSVFIFFQSGKLDKDVFHTLSIQEKKGILEVDLSAPIVSDNIEFIIDKLQAIPEIKEILYTDNSFFSNRYIDLFEKDNIEERNQIKIFKVGSNFLDFLNLSLIGGDVSFEKNQVVINENLAKWIGQGELIDKIIYSYSGNYSVSGIVEDIHTSSRNELSADLIWTLSEKPQYLYLKVAPNDINIVKNKVNNLLDDFPYSDTLKPITSLEDLIEKEGFMINQIKGLILFFAIVSLIIAILGVYSTIILDAEKRRKEVAVRKINCATSWNIILLFIKKYITIYLISVILLTPVLYFFASEVLLEFSARIDIGFFFWFKIYLLIAFILGIVITSQLYNIIRVNPADVIKDN